MVPPPGVQCAKEINDMRPQTGKIAPLIPLTTYAQPPNKYEHWKWNPLMVSGEL